MSSGLTKTDFAHDLAKTLAIRRNDFTTGGDRYSNVDENVTHTKAHEYENSSQEVEYVNREIVMRMKKDHSNETNANVIDNNSLKRHKKIPQPFPKSSPMTRVDLSSSNNLQILKSVIEDDCVCDDGIYYDTVLNDNSIYIKSETKRSLRNSSTTENYKETGLTKSTDPDLRSKKIETSKIPQGTHKNDKACRSKNKSSSPDLPPIKLPPPVPQPYVQKRKSQDISTCGKGSLMVENNCVIGDSKNSLRRSKSNVTSIGEVCNDNDKELRGFMDCYRLDRSVKVASNQETWRRCYLFLAEGILSFFEKETDMQNNKDLPTETTFLKDSAILINKPAMDIITIHCCNGISYKLTHRNFNVTKTWYNFLKHTEILLKEKQKNIIKTSPCLSPAIKQADTGMTYVSNAFQLNKAKLIQFIRKRITKNELTIMGIYKEPTFGGSLEATCLLDESPGPPTFIKMCVDQIEKRGLTEDGIYRKSGSFSAIQCVRMEINDGIFRFEEVMDVHILTGVVKLYFRELANPLIPVSVSNSFVSIIGLSSTRKVEVLMKLLNELNSFHMNTLRYFMRHLRRVSDYEASNRMTIKNLSLIFGPTLAWSDEGGSIPRMITSQALLVECLLEHQSSLFKDR